MLQLNNTIILVEEIKAGTSRRLRNMRIFLEEHPKSPCGIRLGADTMFNAQQITSYPLYGAARVVIDEKSLQHKALMSLLD